MLDKRAEKDFNCYFDAEEVRLSGDRLYLIKNGKLVGKLPEFGISGNIYELFGKDFMGVSKDRPLMNEHYVILKMKISGK